MYEFMCEEEFDMLNQPEERLPLNEMANLSPERTGLSVTIWSENDGVSRKIQHNDSRVRVGKNDYWVEITSEEDPVIKAQSSNIKKSEMKQLLEGIEYVSRNHDLFLKHFNSSNEEFDDEDLRDALRSRGEFK